ncbi:MAG: BMP family lipoprotein [Candidatus Thorarchaeota archaeon]|jgi:basic membrane protein A
MASKGTMAAIVIVIIGIAGVGAYIIMFNPFGPVTNPNEVAIVFATGGLGDKSFNDGCLKGANDAKTEFNIDFVYAEPTAISDYEGFLRGYAEHAQYIEPYDLIISVGFDQEVALQTIANESPDQKFAIVDMFIDPIVYPNVASLLFKEQDGSALVGAIAGLTTTTDKIGFVGGLDIQLINKFAAGFIFGAGYVNPQLNGTANILANFTAAYTNDWVDTASAQTLCDGMFDAGADVVFGAAGRAGLGIFDSVKDKNATSDIPLWVIGVDQPQMWLGTATADFDNPVPPTLCLTTMIKAVDVAIHDIIEEWVVDESWATGFGLLHTFDLSNDGHDYEVDTDLLTLDPAIITEVEALKAAIIAGTVVVPDDVYWT